MQLTPVEELPVKKANCQYKNLREYLDSFMKENVKCVHVKFAPYEFANVYSACGSFNRIIRMFDYPVEVTIINSELYLIRTDMEDRV
jgi:hypothetical protein